MNIFTKESIKVTKLDPNVAMLALCQGTSDDHFKRSLAKTNPKDMTMLLERAGKYIQAEEIMNMDPTSAEGSEGSKKLKDEQEYDVDDKYPRTDRDSDAPPKMTIPGQRFMEYARLNTPRSQILMEIENDKDLRWPKPLRTYPERRNKNQYCRFHQDVGHDTDDCRKLKDEIEFLIRRGRLSKFTKDGEQNNPRWDYERKDDDRDRNPQPRGHVINMISRRSNSSRDNKEFSESLCSRSYAYCWRSTEACQNRSGYSF